jgi:putative two-component system protein, hydrogenase maturation factor HypX/HoxX
MRILLLATSFNALTQRIYVELTERGHDVSVELDINDACAIEAVRLFRPDLVIAPFLRRAISEAVWRTVRCLIVHPGPVADRGPAALDWAILEGAANWGTTLIEATAAFDAGDIWATRNFKPREATKSSLYRDEVTEAALACVIEAIGKINRGVANGQPLSDAAPAGGTWRPVIKIKDRAINWPCDTTATVMRKLRAASGQPGIPDCILGLSARLHDPWPEDTLRGPPGEIIARRDGAVCRSTIDGAVWITAITPDPAAGTRRFKIPATLALADRLDGIPERPIGGGTENGPNTFREISYRETNGVGWLSFEFLNGAMSVNQCRRLLEAYRYAAATSAKVIVLAGGREFWSNGMHLGVIEAAASPADESWANINAIDDLACAVLHTSDKLVIAALEGNSGAGGVFLALAADQVLMRDGIVLNPHYKNMGNIFGSEYWTYVLPRRVGPERVEAIMGSRLPIGAAAARRQGLVDAVLPNARPDFRAAVQDHTERLAADPAFDRLIAEKRVRRERDEAERPLKAYRIEELERMRLAFYGFDPSYHVARWRFITHEPIARTPLYLARHRARLSPRRARAADDG